MHYRNGTEAHNGDSVIYRGGDGTTRAGVLHSTSANSDTCNGQVAVPIPGGIRNDYINIKDLYPADAAFDAMEAVYNAPKAAPVAEAAPEPPPQKAA